VKYIYFIDKTRQVYNTGVDDTPVNWLQLSFGR
jgi:hypothetical protein